MITYFKSVTDTNQPFFRDVNHAIARIRSGEKTKDIIAKIRSEDDKAKRNVLKKLLPAICFSGKFNKREASACVEHSGIICIDFDGFESELDMLDYRSSLESDPYSFSVFTSPSGDGLKVLVKIPKDISNHKNYFLSLEKYYNKQEFDQSCKDISRVCYESYDPEIYVNNDSLTWDNMLVEEHTIFDRSTSRNTIKLEDQSEVVRRLIIWWERKFGMVQGQKNNNLLILGKTLNEFGIPEQEAKTIMLSYDEGGKEREIMNILRSAYKDTSIHGTKFYEDTEKIDAIKEAAKKGTPIEQIDAEGVDRDTVKEIAEKSSFDDEFWHKNSKGVVKHINHLYKEYLEHEGYYKYYPDSQRRNFVFIKIDNNTISDATEDLIKDHVLEMLYDMPDRSIYNYFADKTKLFKEDHLSFLSKIEPNFIKDDSRTAHLYFRNCAVRVTPQGVQTVDYMDIDGHIWEKQIIDRDFVVADHSDCVYKKFISRIGGDEDDRINSIESTIGYLMHGYKPPSYSPAVILNDEMISDNPNGGSGKSLFVKAISHIRKTVTIDGKGFSFNKAFAYQRVSADTQLLTFDDVSKNFEFERLFSIITEGITLEKKNKDEIHIPFADSPKIVITTNYAIKGTGGSHDRRKWELEFSQHYHKGYTPEHEFGHQLFTDWDTSEWNRFDNYMMSCLQLYLQKSFIKSKFKNLRTRSFIAATSNEFHEWASDRDNDLTRANTENLGQKLYDNFVDQYIDYGARGRYPLTHKKFYQWLDLWGEFMYNCKPAKYKSSVGQMIRFEVKLSEQLNMFS